MSTRRVLKDSLGYLGATITRLPDGKVFVWYAHGPEVWDDIPKDALEKASDNPQAYWFWLDYWNEEEFHG